MICVKKSESKDWQNERGNAALIAIIFLAFGALTVLTVMVSNSFRESRNLDKSRSKLHEKWQARSGVNTLAQIVAKDAPKQIENDVRDARNLCGLPTSLPIFDDDDVRVESVPAVIFRGTDINCAELSLNGSPTSIFGNFSKWRDARIPVFEFTAHDKFRLDAENIKIVQLDEIYRRTLTDADVAYAVRYIVEAKFGNYRTRTSGEIIFGSNIPTCGTSVELEVTPTTVERGNPVNMTITYAYANKIQIFNSAGTMLHEELVAEQSASQTYTYRFTPASTETYRVTASGSGGCQARSTNVVITVAEPTTACPRVIDFSSSATTINQGESVMLSWNVQDASVVVFEGGNVAAVGSQSFTLNATRTFTLIARDAANNCPVTKQITVTVRTVTPPSCTSSTPQINFTANPTMIAVGENSTLTWTISGLDSGGSATLTGAGGVSQTVGNSGSQTITPPNSPGDYTYTLTAENVCSDGTRLTARATVIISVRACPPPDISAFTVNPSTVTAGNNQMIAFAWNIGGTADVVTISNGVGGGLPANGTVEVLQPQITTTYTITAVGCGQTRQAQVTVNVTACPIPIIDSFAANPNTVTQGGNQTVRLSWSVSGTANNINISGIGNVTGNYIDIPQPQTTTTYTLNVNGCDVSASASITINVIQNPVVTQTAQLELAQNGGVFSCRTGNDFRITNGFPPIPCTNWIVDFTITLEKEPAGTYLLTAHKISNADSSPDLGARGFAPQIGIFGIQNGSFCTEYAITMCLENRQLLAFWTPYINGTANFGGIVQVDFDAANNYGVWRLPSISGTEKIVFEDTGFGTSTYRIYFRGFNFGPNDRQDAGYFNYDFVNNCCGGRGYRAIFDPPQ